MNKLLLFLSLLAIIALAACNLPGAATGPTQEPQEVFTQVAQTVSAELTRVAPLITPTFTGIATGSYAPLPSNTPMYTPTQTPIPCLLVGYSDASIDVTVPDNTVMTPGQAFIKTWRLKNIGTCTWNSSYQLVFDHKDPMGIPSNYSQPLTSGTVAPGQEVDVSVNLIAPTQSGTYTGYWRFRDPNGVYFGIGGSSAWIVKIKVGNATPTP